MVRHGLQRTKKSVSHLGENNQDMFLRNEQMQDEYILIKYSDLLNRI